MRVVIVVSVVLLMAGCGDSESRGVEGTDPAVWARNVCTAFRNWRAPTNADLLRRLEKPKGTVEARTVLIAFWGDAVARTDDFLRDLDAAGSPAVEDGDKMAQGLRRGIVILRTAFARAKERSRGLPVDDRESFVAMNRRIAESIEPAGERMERYFDRMDESLKTPELDRIFDSECP